MEVVKIVGVKQVFIACLVGRFDIEIKVSFAEERIADELQLKLGIRVSPRTVEKYLRDGGPVGTPDPKPRWLTFGHNHGKVIVACDFFVVVTATFRNLYVFVWMEIGSRRILHHNVTAHPTAEWTLQPIPPGTSGQSCLSFCDPRPGRHLLQAIGSGSDGPRSESSSNSGSGAQGQRSR